MVTVHALVIVFISFVCFSLGRLSGRAEAYIIFSKRLNDIVCAIKKLDEISSLRGQNISNMSAEEIVQRTKKIMELDDEQS